MSDSVKPGEQPPDIGSEMMSVHQERFGNLFRPLPSDSSRATAVKRVDDNANWARQFILSMAGRPLTMPFGVQVGHARRMKNKRDM